uniref:Uncharacterized protein n=1 Tax=Theileria annulata TaxID=5874 RepID=A0A3B0MG47_THEAN
MTEVRDVAKSYERARSTFTLLFTRIYFNNKYATVMAAGYLLFSAAVWAFFTSPRKHEWVDVLLDYANHRRSQYSGLWSHINKIPNYFQNYTKLTLYFGDWRRIESDCLYLRDKRDLDNLTVLSKICNRNTVDSDLKLDNEGLVECAGIIENCKFVYFPSQNNSEEHENLSLLVPLDLFYSEMYNSTGVNYVKDGKGFVAHLNSLGFNKILLCSGNNNVYNFYHNLLKY